MSVQLSSCAITIINKRPKSRPFCSKKPFNKLLNLAFNVFDNHKTCIKIALFCQISDHFGARTKYASCACRMHIASDYKYVLSEKCAKFFEIMFLNLCLCVCVCVSSLLLERHTETKKNVSIILSHWFLVMIYFTQK